MHENKEAEEGNTCKNGSSLRTESYSLLPYARLGMKLRPPRNGIVTSGITVDHITNEDLAGKISTGDLLIRIGNDEIRGQGFSDVIDWIRKRPRPLELVFEISERRRQRAQKIEQENVFHTETQVATYAVVFEGGSPMGLNLEDAVKYGIDGAIVKAVKGQAEEVGDISVGDIVYKVNGEEVLFLPYKKVVALIRESSSPRTLLLVPKDKLGQVQQLNTRQSEVFGGIESMMLMANARQSSRMIKSDQVEKTSITDIILQNSGATIKKGTLYKQGGSMVRINWKSRYCVLSVSSFEYFKSADSTSSREKLTFLGHRCLVRELPGSNDIACKTPLVKAGHLIELRVADRRLIVACSSKGEKEAWMEAMNLAIEASKTVGRTKPPREIMNSSSSNEEEKSRNSSRFSVSRFSEVENMGFPTPVVHISVLSATRLTKEGNTLNAYCEIECENETYRTSTVKNARNPVWRQDNETNFELPKESSVLILRIFNKNTFRSSDLLSTLSVPIASLPNMQKAIKKYPLVLSSRASGAQITLSLEYINKGRAHQQEEDRMKLGDDMARESVMIERTEMIKIQVESQAAADDADARARVAEEEAQVLMKSARATELKYLLAVKEDKSAVKEAMEVAAVAKKEAERQTEEARQAMEEALMLIEANKLAKASTNEGMERNRQEGFFKYRRMMHEKEPQDAVRACMLEDGVDERDISLLFENVAAYEQKLKDLQKEVDMLKRSKTMIEKDGAFNALANSAMTGDQEKILRRLLKLEKQLKQAGITIAEDIPYHEAKEKVKEISTRMVAIGGADVTHEDRQIQQNLREEYFKLEQEVAKYSAALMMTDEYAQESTRKEEEWEARNKLDNLEALSAVRSCMPVQVKKRSIEQLMNEASPNGKFMKNNMAAKFKRSNVLVLLRDEPAAIIRSHPSTFESLAISGLSITERRALHVHLKDVAETWKSCSDEMSGRKLNFFNSLKKTFKELSEAYYAHVELYGPPGNHPYATRDDPDNGCPLLGNQCPLKANKVIDYAVDLGHPKGAVYVALSIQKSEPEDAGKIALQEAKDLSRAKSSNARKDLLKKHYRGNVHETTKANGACDDMDKTTERIENTQRNWVQTRMKAGGKTRESIKAEVTEFNNMIKTCRLACITYAERSGMQLSGKRSAKHDDEPDMRSSVEISLLDILLDAMEDCVKGIQKRIKECGVKEQRIKSSIETLRTLTSDIYSRNQKTMKNEALKKVTAVKKIKHLEDIVREEMKARAEASVDAVSETDSSGKSGRGGGRGSRGGGPARANLLGSISGRSGGSGGPARANLLGSISGRRRGSGGPGHADSGRNRGGGGRSDMFAAISARKKE